jgi:hypothetical protein
MAEVVDTENAAAEGDKLVPGDFDWQAAETAAASDFEAAHLDSDTLLLDRSGGVTERLHFDPMGESFALERVQDVEATLEWCRGRYNAGLANSHCEFRHYASLPVAVLEIWGKSRGITQPDWYLKKENEKLLVEAAHDRDLSGFRTLAGNFMRRGE